ncbi:hypothetical protein IEQ34_007307 [Dendrobium chrysotoxum]|uniref:Uncharacterized protein n=1 Tax=Dendrobium chrysotoxum TaxID=161865 RepID=A0AAV7H5Y5_DENCH|nr:hypothetical protein IEQ34_007307 [Dendrobium chrysotoxum]
MVKITEPFCCFNCNFIPEIPVQVATFLPMQSFHCHLLTVGHDPLVYNAGTAFSNDVLLLETIKHIVAGKVQALKCGELPCTGLTGFLQRPRFDYGNDGERNGTEELRDAAVEVVPGEVEIVQDPHSSDLLRDLTRQIVPTEVYEGKETALADLRSDTTGKDVTAKLLHSREITDGGRERTREVIVREGDLAEIGRDPGFASVGESAGEEIVLQLNLSEIGKAKEASRDGAIKTSIGLGIPGSDQRGNSRERLESVACYRSTDPAGDCREQRRDLTREGIVRKVHRLEASEPAELRRKLSRKDVHLQENRVEVLEVPDLTRDLACEATIRHVEPHEFAEVPDLWWDSTLVAIEVPDIKLPEMREIPNLPRYPPAKLVA